MVAITDHNKFYSRLEIFCNFSIDLPGFKKEKCFSIKDDTYYNFRKEYDVYAQEFDNFDAVINCLYEIEQAWKTLKIARKLDDIYQNICGSVMIYNRWEINLNIGMYADRWMLSDSSKYTNEWKDNLSKFGRNSREITAFIPHCEVYDESEFISKEKVCLLIKQYLEENNWNGDFDYESYYEYLLEFQDLWIKEM
jgi:hypothetical protein